MHIYQHIQAHTQTFHIYTQCSREKNNSIRTSFWSMKTDLMPCLIFFFVFVFLKVKQNKNCTHMRIWLVSNMHHTCKKLSSLTPPPPPLLGQCLLVSRLFFAFLFFLVFFVGFLCLRILFAFYKISCACINSVHYTVLFCVCTL